MKPHRKHCRLSGPETYYSDDALTTPVPSLFADSLQTFRQTFVCLMNTLGRGVFTAATTMTQSDSHSCIINGTEVPGLHSVGSTVTSNTTTISTHLYGSLHNYLRDIPLTRGFDVDQDQHPLITSTVSYGNLNATHFGCYRYILSRSSSVFRSTIISNILDRLRRLDLC